MAQRRMFSRKITESDQFLDMPMSAQVLYFHVNMQADDDGFVGNVKTIKRMIGASDDDLRLLIQKEFLIPFENGVVVIRDWKIHNYIQKDRYNETFYKSEKAMLETLENKQYQLTDTECIQDVSSSDTQVRLGKVRLGKDSLGKDSLGKSNSQKKTATSQSDKLVTKSYTEIEIDKDLDIEGDVDKRKKNSNSNNDDKKHNPFIFYQANGFGTIAPIVRDKIVAIHDDLKSIGSSDEEADKLIILSLEMAATRNIRNWAYAEKILINWHNKGYKTVADVDASEKQFQAKKNNYHDASIPEEKSHEALEVERRTKELLDATIIPDDMEFI